MANLEWREFLKDSKGLNFKQKCQINDEFEGAERFIYCMSNYYDLKTVVPHIRVDSFLGSKKNKSLLYHDESDKSINVSADLLFEYFNPKKLNEIEQTRNYFLWGIAHEFFHHGRNHIAIWEKYQIIENDTSPDHIQLLLCLEDDADTLATAALYRSFLFNAHKQLESYDVKLKVLAALFKPIRLRIQESKNKTPSKHPSWKTRLCSQIIKLAELDNIFNDPHSPEKRITEKTLEQQNKLTDALVKMDKEYADDSELLEYIYRPVNYTPQDEVLNKEISSYPKSLVTKRFLDLYCLNEKSKDIGEFLRKNSKLPGLNDSDREWLPKVTQSG